MDIKLTPQLKRELSDVRGYGYESKQTFVEDAIRHWVLELKEEGFLSRVKKIRRVIKERGLTEKEITQDFESFRQSSQI